MVNDAAGPRNLIVHIVHRFDYGGLENGIVNIINGTSRLGLNHAVVALTEATSFRERLIPGIPVHELAKRPGKDLAAYVRLYRLLRQLRPAVVHTRNVGTIDCSFVAFVAGVPVRVHGEHGWDIFDPDGAKPKYRWLRRIFGRFIDCFVTVSEDLRAWLVSEVGLDAARIMRICNGVDVDRFRPAYPGEPSPIPERFRLEGGFVIGSVTRFSPIKDPLNLVDAFIRLCADGLARDVRLVMIGEGELRAAALARLEKAGVAEYAWLPGSRDDIPALLRGFDLFVLGSLREGISNTVLEAMASGVPVVATDTGGNRELIVPGETGALVPPANSGALADAVRTYVLDRNRCKVHGKNARERAVSQFSLASMIDNYRRLYGNWLASAKA